MTGFQDRASGCCPRSSECQNALGVVLRVGRCNEWFIEPSHQIAVGEEIHAQECDEVGQAPAEAGGQLQVAQQQHRDQCCPNLRLDGVGRGADESLDLQVLLERFEEQFDLPAILVDRGDGAGTKAMMIGDEDENAAGVFADSLDPTQQVRTLFLRAGTGQADGLILEDVAVLRHCVLLDDLEQCVVLHPGDEIDVGLRPFGEQPVVVVTPVIDDDGVGCEVHLMGRLDVRHLAVGDDAEARQVAIVVEHQMQLDRAFGAPELRPVIHGEAQIDHGRIDADQLVLETELLLPHRLGGDSLEQPVEHLLEKLPRAMRVGVGQRRARRRFDTQVGEFAFATLQTTFDLAQGMGSAQLAEQHADKLAPARQPLASIFRPSLFDDAFEVGSRDELEYLAEHAA